MLPGPFAMWAKRLMVLAVMLAALAFVGIGRAEAAEHHHQPHAHSPAPAHHVDPKAATMPLAEQGAPSPHDGDGGVHHDGGCHCMSAACISVMPVTLSELRVYLPRARHALPLPIVALALAGVDPPTEPPRT